MDDMTNQPTLDVGRRAFLATIAGGFALAVQPISAETLLTPADGLAAGLVSVKAADRAIPAYRAYPAGKPQAPVVLVVQEAFGLHEHIKDICRRLAHLGYYAIAPDLYVRQGDATRIADVMQIVREIIPKVPDAQVMSDLDASVAFAKSEGAATQRLALTGFCWGGRIAWLYAEHNPALKAVVAWYGYMTGFKMGPLQPKDPLEDVASLKAPVLGLYGADDDGNPPSAIKAMQDAAKAKGKTVSFEVYPNTPHAFFADYRPSYREGPAKDGWRRMQAWFKQHGA